MKPNTDYYIESYQYNDEYFIDIVTINTGSAFEYESWIWHKDYGVKDLMFGLFNPNGGKKGFVNLAENSAEEYIKTYQYHHVDADMQKGELK